MPDALTGALITQGGFAVFCAYLLWLMHRNGEKRVAEEREVAKLALSAVIKSTEALSSFAEKIEGLRDEQAGLRNGIHEIRNAMSSVRMLVDYVMKDKGL